MACTQSPSPRPEPWIVRLEERRPSTSAWSIRSASTTVESPNPAGSGAMPSMSLSGRAGMLSSCPIGSTAFGCTVFSRASQKIASSRVSAAFPDLTPPSRVDRARSWIQRGKPPGVQRDPNDLCSRAGRSNPLLPHARRNRAPHVADLVMRDGDKETPSHPRFVGCREEGVEPPFR